MTKLDLTIKYIDDLIQALKSGTLSARAGGASVTPAPRSAPAPAAAAAPAPKPAPKPKEKKPATKPAKAAATGPAEGSDLFAKSQLVVARVDSVEIHPNSDKLYICKLDVGTGEHKQVVAGLQQYIPQEQLQTSLVVCILNLKPAKLGGELSEAMILAASFVKDDGAKEVVKTLQVGEGSQPGDAVYLEGGSAPGAYPKQLKSDSWKKIVAALGVKGDNACFEGAKMVTMKGEVKAVGMDGAEIH